MPMIPLPPPPMGAPPPGQMGAAPGLGPIPLPPPPAAIAGDVGMQLAPIQAQEQQALQQKQLQDVIGLLSQQLAGAPNPAAEAAQGMPAAMVSPDGGGAPIPGDPNDPFGGA